jgi:hypothetical protein
MVVLTPGGPPMSRRVYLSHPDMPKGDFRYWHKADMQGRPIDVRYRGQSGSWILMPRGQLLTRLGH